MSKKLRNGAVATAAGLLFASSSMAAGITLPDLGVDVGAYATAMGTDLGNIFITVLGISAVFIAGKIGWRWMRKAGA